MFGSDELYEALNVTSITDLLEDFLTGKSLFVGSLVPQAFTGDASINFYMINPRNFGDSFEEYVYSVNCRDSSYTLSRTLAQAAIAAINRLNSSNYYIVCNLLATIPPADDTDNYNTPIEATIKLR